MGEKFIADARHYTDAGFIAAARSDVPWLLDRLAAATAEVERLTRRLWPSQGEGYANEVERQRVVIDGLQAAALSYQAERDAATERADKAEAAARDEVGAAIQEQADWLNGRTEDAWLGAVWADVAKFVNNHEAKEQQ